jgi:hypothetical protein
VGVEEAGTVGQKVGVVERRRWRKEERLKEKGRKNSWERERKVGQERAKRLICGQREGGQ